MGRDGHQLGDIDLGRHMGQAKVIQNRKAQTVVHRFEHGWSIVAARTGQPVNKARFRALVYRCQLDSDCQRYRCLGHAEGVDRLAEKIRKTYA